MIRSIYRLAVLCKVTHLLTFQNTFQQSLVCTLSINVYLNLDKKNLEHSYLSVFFLNKSYLNIVYVNLYELVQARK